VGRVEVASDADLTMQANREGFIENDAFSRLKELLRESLQWMTLQYSRYLSVKAEQEYKEEVEELGKQLESESNDSGGLESESSDSDGLESFKSESQDDSESTESDPSSQLEDDPVDISLEVINKTAAAVSSAVPEEDREVADETVNNATEVIKKELDKKNKKIDFFRSAFSVNQLIFGFSHELRGMINELNVNATRIENVLEDIPTQHQSRFEEVAEDLRDMQRRFEQQMDLFGIFMKSGEDEHTKPQDVYGISQDIVESTEYIRDFYDVETELDVPEILRTPPMYESELHSILINLIVNSIKAIGAANEADGKIKIEGESSADGVVLRVYDDGIGIDEDMKEEAFQALVSDPGGNLYDNLNENMPEDLTRQLGSGSGLGLNIVQNIAEKYDGDADFVDTDNWATCVEVTINE
jgi:signal transduction histidine kinase